MKIDFDEKDTEAGWQKRLDKFWLAAAPKWFEWIGWLFLLGALKFVEKKTSNFTVTVISNVSYVLLFMYFQSHFYQFEFVNIPFVKKHPKLARFTSLGISGLLGIGIFLLISYSIAEFKS